MSREPCPYQDARPFQYAFVAGVLRVEYLKEALQQRRPALQGGQARHILLKDECQKHAVSQCSHYLVNFFWSPSASRVLLYGVLARTHAFWSCFNAVDISS